MTSFAADARRLPHHHNHHPRPLARRRLDRKRLRPPTRQLELPHPAPHRRGPARRSRSALRQPGGSTSSTAPISRPVWASASRSWRPSR